MDKSLEDELSEEFNIKHECYQRDCPCENKPKHKARNKTERKCLSCDKAFMSYSIYERLCKQCKLDERFR